MIIFKFRQNNEWDKKTLFEQLNEAETYDLYLRQQQHQQMLLVQNLENELQICIKSYSNAILKENLARQRNRNYNSSISYLADCVSLERQRIENLSSMNLRPLQVDDMLLRGSPHNRNSVFRFPSYISSPNKFDHEQNNSSNMTFQSYHPLQHHMSAEELDMMTKASHQDKVIGRWTRDDLGQEVSIIASVESLSEKKVESQNNNEKVEEMVNTPGKKSSQDKLTILKINKMISETDNVGDITSEQCSSKSSSLSSSFEIVLPREILCKARTFYNFQELAPLLKLEARHNKRDTTQASIVTESTLWSWSARSNDEEKEAECRSSVLDGVRDIPTGADAEGLYNGEQNEAIKRHPSKDVEVGSQRETSSSSPDDNKNNDVADKIRKLRFDRLKRESVAKWVESHRNIRPSFSDDLEDAKSDGGEESYSKVLSRTKEEVYILPTVQKQKMLPFRRTGEKSSLLTLPNSKTTLPKIQSQKQQASSNNEEDEEECQHLLRCEGQLVNSNKEDKRILMKIEKEKKHVHDHSAIEIMAKETASHLRKSRSQKNVGGVMSELIPKPPPSQKKEGKDNNVNEIPPRRRNTRNSRCREQETHLQNIKADPSLDAHSRQVLPPIQSFSAIKRHPSKDVQVGSQREPSSSLPDDNKNNDVADKIRKLSFDRLKRESVAKWVESHRNIRPSLSDDLEDAKSDGGEELYSKVLSRTKEEVYILPTVQKHKMLPFQRTGEKSSLLTLPNSKTTLPKIQSQKQQASSNNEEDEEECQHLLKCEGQLINSNKEDKRILMKIEKEKKHVHDHSAIEIMAKETASHLKKSRSQKNVDGVMSELIPKPPASQKKEGKDNKVNERPLRRRNTRNSRCREQETHLQNMQENPSLDDHSRQVLPPIRHNLASEDDSNSDCCNKKETMADNLSVFTQLPPLPMKLKQEGPRDLHNSGFVKEHQPNPPSKIPRLRTSKRSIRLLKKLTVPTTATTLPVDNNNNNNNKQPTTNTKTQPWYHQPIDLQDYLVDESGAPNRRQRNIA